MHNESILLLRDIYLDHQALAERTTSMSKDDGWNIILGSTVELNTNMSLHDAILEHTDLSEGDIASLALQTENGRAALTTMKVRPPYYATKNNYSAAIWVDYFGCCAHTLKELSEIEDEDEDFPYVPSVYPKIILAFVLGVIFGATIFYLSNFA